MIGNTQGSGYATTAWTRRCCEEGIEHRVLATRRHGAPLAPAAALTQAVGGTKRWPNLIAAFNVPKRESHKKEGFYFDKLQTAGCTGVL